MRNVVTGQLNNNGREKRHAMGSNTVGIVETSSYMEVPSVRYPYQPIPTPQGHWSSFSYCSIYEGKYLARLVNRNAWTHLIHPSSRRQLENENR